MKNTKYRKLPKRFKEQFLAALRSGKYKKGTGRLYNKETGRYCILGVAGVVAKISKKKLAERFGLAFTTEDYGKNNRVPKTLLGKGDDSVASFLMQKNDDAYWSFEKAADWIEKNL